jgi:hypothetical protein
MAMLDQNDVKLVSQLANGHIGAIAILARCLQNNGALNPGQYEAALQATISDAGAESERPDYFVMKSVLKLLGDTPPGQPIRQTFYVIDGGRTD